MDPLSDLLRVVRLDGAYFYTLQAPEQWSVEAVHAKELSPRLMPSAEHLIPYHILVEGHCYGGLRGEEQTELVGGDVVVLPHGDAHTMSSGLGIHAGLNLQRTPPARFPFTLFLGKPGPPVASLVCGFLGCDRRPFNPLLMALPRLMHMRNMSSAWRGIFVRQVTEETRLGRAGAEEVITRMAELMFIEVLRRYLDDLPAGQTGWLAGLRDEVVGRALTLLHSQPGEPWTLPKLAREAASSRSSLAKRFATARWAAADAVPRPVAHAGRRQPADAERREGRHDRGGGRVRLRGCVQPRIQEGDRTRSRRLALGSTSRSIVGPIRPIGQKNKAPGISPGRFSLPYPAALVLRSILGRVDPSVASLPRDDGSGCVPPSPPRGEGARG